MNTEHWASLDQYTSFAKEPWGFNRPENRKDSSFLSKATFVEWPNTTCDFSLRRGVAPPGKLAKPKESRPRHDNRAPSRNGSEGGAACIVSGDGSAVVGSASSPSRTTNPAARQQQPPPVKANSRQCSRDSINVDNPGNRDARGPTASTANAVNSYNGTVKIRHSADAATAAYALWSRENSNASLPLPQRAERTSGGHPAREMSTWSVNNIGFSDVKGEAQKARERGNRETYANAAFAAQEADKPYIAEATHFRCRYPHTLGRIAAMSHARNDQAGTGCK